VSDGWPRSCRRRLLMTSDIRENRST
jgi:hypothetical protein